MLKKSSKGKPHAATSLLVTTLDMDNNIMTNVVDNFDISLEKEKEYGVKKMILHTNQLQGFKIGHHYNMHILATTDPTIKTALGSGSLGFFRFRWKLLNCKLNSLNPAVFEAMSKQTIITDKNGMKHQTFRVEVLLDQWDYDDK